MGINPNVGRREGFDEGGKYTVQQNATQPTEKVAAAEEQQNNEIYNGGPGSLGKYYVTLSIGKYVRPNPTEKTNWSPKTFIYLPLPTELRDNSPVGYSNVNLETVGDLINGASGTGGAAGLRASGSLIMRGAETGMDGVTKGLSSLPGIAGKIAGGASQALSDEALNLINAEQITSAVQQSQGLAPNPNPSVVFQGPQLRDFSFSWAFYPRNKEASLNIQAMIRKLKQVSQPTVDVSRDSALLGYPQMCQLNFYPWDGMDKSRSLWGWGKSSIIRYKKCMIQDVFVSYNAFGTPSFFEGTNLPTSYQITISFKEIEYMLSENWGGANESLQDRASALSTIAGSLLTIPGDIATAVLQAGGGS